MAADSQGQGTRARLVSPGVQPRPSSSPDWCGRRLALPARRGQDVEHAEDGLAEVVVRYLEPTWQVDLDLPARCRLDDDLNPGALPTWAQVGVPLTNHANLPVDGRWLGRKVSQPCFQIRDHGQAAGLKCSRSAAITLGWYRKRS